MVKWLEWLNSIKLKKNCKSDVARQYQSQIYNGNNRQWQNSIRLNGK